MKKIYLDNGSTSFPKAPGVGEAMRDFIENVGCNVGRGGYSAAYDLADKIYETRTKLARLFGFRGAERVIFTPGVTYSLNYIIRGLLHRGDNVIISSMEHNAVARPCEQIKTEGVTVTYAPCDSEGRLNFAEFEKLFIPETRLVILIHSSNVSGTLLDVERAGKVCREKGVFFALDAAQSAGTVSIDFEKAGLSALCVPGHKGLMGPQGIGVMLISPELASDLHPIICGGTGSASDLLTMPDFLPDKFEAGTLNIPGIIGLGAALDFIDNIGESNILEHELRLAGAFMDEVEKLQGVRIVGPRGIEGRTGVVSLDFVGRDNAEIAYILESEYGIMTRCGLHCAPLAHKTLGTFPQGTVRFSFGYFNTEEDTEYAARAVRAVCGQ